MAIDLEKVDFVPLLIFAFFGIPLVIQYYILFRNYNEKTKDLLWGGMPHIMRRISLLNIVLTGIAGPFMVYYTTARLPQKGPIFNMAYDESRYIVYTSIFIFTLFANVWYLSLASRWPQKLTVTALVGTAVGCILLSACVYSAELSKPRDELDRLGVFALICATILLIQTSIFDGIIWNYYFLTTQCGCKDKKYKKYKKYKSVKT